MTTPPWNPATDDELLQLLCGNSAAVRMVKDIAFLSHAYDDLIDRDKPVPVESIHALFWKVMVALPDNPFWREHQAQLVPVIATSILNWRAANEIERDGVEEELRVAHAIRYSIADVLLLAMAIAGGPAHAAAHARRARLAGQQDTWAHYLSEHLKEQPCP